MVVSHRGETFVCVFYSKGSLKCKSHIVDFTLSIIEEVNDKTVVQIVIDNTSNSKNVGNLEAAIYSCISSMWFYT